MLSLLSVEFHRNSVSAIWIALVVISSQLAHAQVDTSSAAFHRIDAGRGNLPETLNRLSKPFIESGLSELRIVFGNECAFGHLYAVVSGLRVSDNFSRILACGQTSPNKFIEAELFRPPYFHSSIHR